MKNAIIVFISTFILNFIWEISQAFLYAPHYVGIAGLITVHLRASLGDILIIFIILALDVIIFRNFYKEKKSNTIRFSAIIFIGLILATLVEKYALATGRWAYNPLMPIIPWLNVGLTPILQMMLIPLFVVVFWSRLKKLTSN